MNLIVDIGNTRSKFFLFNEAEEMTTKKIFLNKEETEIENFLKASFFKKMIVSSTKRLAKFFSDYTFLELDNKTPIPIKINYATPKTLGSDRIALSVGAETLFPNKNCLMKKLGGVTENNNLPGSTFNIFKSKGRGGDKKPATKITDCKCSGFCLAT